MATANAHVLDVVTVHVAMHADMASGTPSPSHGVCCLTKLNSSEQLAERNGRVTYYLIPLAYYGNHGVDILYTNITEADFWGNLKQTRTYFEMPGYGLRCRVAHATILDYKEPTV